MRSRAFRTRSYVTGMKSTILALILIVAAGTAYARGGGHATNMLLAPGLAGNGGRMPQTMSPGLQPPTSMPTPRQVPPGGTQSMPTRMPEGSARQGPG